MTLTGYYNRFSATKNFDAVEFLASKGLQSAELNEVQSIFNDRLQNISNVLFKDGGVVRGGSATIDPATGAVTLETGSIYVAGAVRNVAYGSFTIPTTGSIQIGVRLVETDVTENDDATLRDPAVGTRNYQEGGAARKKRVISWGWSGDGNAGTFFSVYDVLNAVLVDQTEPPSLDAAQQLVARYDRDANGNYIVNGLNLIALGKDVSGSNHIFTVQDGVGNVQGFKITKPQSTPQSFPIDPDLQGVANEPRVSNTNSTQTITTSRKPFQDIQDVVITEERTSTMTHGAFTGALDALPDSSVLSIQSVEQDGTTYSEGTDFVLTADQVDWSPGGNEVAPGSTYSVTYRCLVSVTPANVDGDNGTFDITGAVSGTLVLTDYRWKLPRIDVLSLDKDGYFHRVKGVSSAFSAVAPIVSAVQLPIATISNDWFDASVPTVENDGTRVTSMKDQRRMKKSIVELYQLVADEKLQRDIATREPTAKYGLFTDPLLPGNNLRDTGVTQDAVIIGQDLQLGITASSTFAAQNNENWSLLPYGDELLITQELSTGSMAINPYANFELLPSRVTLNPNIDLWTVFDEQTEETTRRITNGWGNMASTNSSVTQELVSEATSDIEFLRPRTVDFTIEGFGNGETLQAIDFDGTDVTPDPAPSANADGTITGQFDIPTGVPAGVKLVDFDGAGGAFGSAEYTGSGELVVRRWNRVTTITTNRWWGGWDPLAQSFTLTEGRQITGIDLKFAAIGNTDNPVYVQIREGNNGFPNQTVLADGIIVGSDLTTANTYVRASFGTPVFLEENREYFVVILTNDATHSVRVAELGQFDSNSQQWVTAQPFTIGVLLSSSNATTWTPHQDKDLTFRLVAAEYSSTSQTVNLGSLTVSSMTDLQAIAPVDLPSNQTSIFFRYTRSTGEVFELTPGQSLQFETSISDTMQIQAVLSGTSKVSPVLFSGVQSVTGTLDNSAFYQSREFPVGSGGSTMRVIFDANIPGTSAVTPEYDNGGFNGLTLSSATPLGDGFNEYVYEDTGITGLSASKIKLSLTGGPEARPKIRNLRAVMV